jgi:hypothetical protein
MTCALSDARAQQPVPVPGAFSGLVISKRDSQPVPLAEVRLTYVDSVHATHVGRVETGADIFIDSTRTRLATTDSIGAFMIRQMLPGRYMLRVRRLGYAPTEGVVSVDSASLLSLIPLEETSHALATVRINERAFTGLDKVLQQSGFNERSHMGNRSIFITRKQILERNALTIRDILSRYGFSDADVILDRMPVAFFDVENYPADNVGGIEIYQHSRPLEFARIPRAFNTDLGHIGVTAYQPSRPTIVIWTFFP